MIPPKCSEMIAVPPGQLNHWPERLPEGLQPSI
jgi:hypothetical protein